MPAELQDGPLGLEARHQWINIETATVLVVLNKLDLDPCYLVTDFTGLYDFDVTDQSEPKTEAVGDEPYPSRVNAKNVTYTIQTRGSTQQLMRRGGAALRAAFGPDLATGLVTTRAMIITPHPDDGGVAEHAYRARCLQYSQGSDVQDRGATAQPTPWVREDVIGLKLDDPRIYEWDPLAPIGFVVPKW